MSYKGGLADFYRKRRTRATHAALKASAQVIVNGLKEPKPQGLRGGYTTGDFITGTLLNSIFISEPFQGANGTWFVLVGTNLAYALYWEVGHVNLYTRKYERQERWRPTLLRKIDQAVAVYHRAYASEMK